MIEMKNENKEIFLNCLKKEHCEIVRIWRNENIETLRTSFFLTKEMQEDFYNNIICNRNSNHRYFGIYEYNGISREGLLIAPEEMEMFANDKLVGMCGITNIEWENGLGEISLIINPEETRQGYGKQSVLILLNKAFNEMRLSNIYGEVYECNKNIGFWKKIIKLLNAYKTILPQRKFYNGKFYDSLYFNIDCNNYKKLVIKYN